jgi:polyhydroxyalkanoate synthase subunit PhaC
MTMTDTEAFAPEKNLAITQGKVVYRNRLIELIQYAPLTTQTYAGPLLFIPPWINKFYILNLTASDAVREIMETQLRVGLRQRPPEKRLEIATIRRQKAQQSGRGFGADPI